MACTGDSVVLLFSENYEIHVLKTKRRSLLQMVWAVLGLRFTLNSLRMIGCIFCLFFKLHIVQFHSRSEKYFPQVNFGPQFLLYHLLDWKDFILM